MGRRMGKSMRRRGGGEEGVRDWEVDEEKGRGKIKEGSREREDDHRKEAKRKRMQMKRKEC